MSIPGSHDAMTFNVSDQVAFAAKSQDLNLRGQWNNGIRVFDFRVRNNGSSVNLYHNFISCNKTFDKSLEELIELVKEHKTSEGAILIIKTEGNDFADNTSSFSSLISWLVDMMTDLEINLSSTKLDQGKTLSYIKAIMERKLIYSDSLFIDFSPNITMGQLKGHIMVINRNDLDISNSLGARATGWDLNCKLYDTKTSTVLNVQDDWGEGKNQSEKEWYTAKYNKFNSLWEQSANTSAEDSTWYVNAASGYITELSIFPNYATAAEELYPAFTQTIQSKPNGHGIVLQDYSGCDRTCRISAKVTMSIALTTQVLPSFMGIRAKALRLALEGARKIASDDIVRGQQLTNAVIESNFQ